MSGNRVEEKLSLKDLSYPIVKGSIRSTSNEIARRLVGKTSFTALTPLQEKQQRINKLNNGSSSFESLIRGGAKRLRQNSPGKENVPANTVLTPQHPHFHEINRSGPLEEENEKHYNIQSKEKSSSSLNNFTDTQMSSSSSLSSSVITSKPLRRWPKDFDEWMEIQEDRYTRILNEELLECTSKFLRRWNSKLIHTMRSTFFEAFHGDYRMMHNCILDAFGSNKFTMRPECDPVYDTGLAVRICNILFSFRREWLSMALEVITGKQISDNLNTDYITLQRFIQQFVFSEMDKSIRHSNKHKERIGIVLFDIVLLIDHVASNLDRPCVFRLV